MAPLLSVEAWPAGQHPYNHFTSASQGRGRRYGGGWVMKRRNLRGARSRISGHGAEQPQVRTAGKRTGDTVFGLIAYFTGRLLYHGQKGRLNSDAYISIFKRVLAHTPQPMMLIQEGAKYPTGAATTAFFTQQTARLQVLQLPIYTRDDSPLRNFGSRLHSRTPMCSASRLLTR
jgi:hypothetical protein